MKQMDIIIAQCFKFDLGWFMIWDLIGIIVLYGMISSIFSGRNSSDKYHADGSPKKEWYY